MSCSIIYTETKYHVETAITFIAFLNSLNKMLFNWFQNLRYLCEMISVHPEDAGRRFVLSYHLADGLIRIDELLADNSGLSGGRFSGPSKLPVPGCSLGTHYTPEMFYIGKRVNFRIE